MFAVWRRVLFVSASPLGSAWLDNDGERLAVRGALRGGGRLLLVEDVPKATRVAVIDALKREAPTILHLSCHGWDNRGIVLEDRSRSADPVPPASFVEMLAQGVGSLRVVVLSACDSDEHVRALAAAFPGLEVIGFVGEVGVEPARVFSEQLYKALAGGATVAAGLAAVRAAVGEAVKAQIVASGPGRFQARPWSTVLGFAALLAGVASAALWAVFLWGSEIETKRESETSELTSIASTSEATGVNDTQETTTSTGATLTSEEPPEETTSTGATLTSEEPPAGTTGRRRLGSRGSGRRRWRCSGR
jgi:hypothetical protein